MVRDLAFFAAGIVACLLSLFALGLYLSTRPKQQIVALDPSEVAEVLAAITPAKTYPAAIPEKHWKTVMH